MTEPSNLGVKLVVYKRIVEGDLSKFTATSNITQTGGGARDLRFSPAAVFFPVFQRMFEKDFDGVLRGHFSWANHTPTDANVHPPTNSRPNEVRIAKIHGGSGNIRQLSGGDALLGRSIVIRVDGDDMPQDIAASLPGQVKIAVVGEIHHRIRVAGRVIIDNQLVVGGQGVGYGHIQGPRESLLHVGHDSGKCRRRP